MRPRRSLSLFVFAIAAWAGLGIQGLAVGVGLQQTSLPVSSSFTTDDEGWTTSLDAEGNPTPRWSASGGNPDGYVSARDSLGNVKWYWQAPPKFLGDLSAAYGTALTFDMRQSSQVNPTNDVDVILVGAGMRLVFDTPYNPTTSWTSYRVPLTVSGGWKKDSLNGPAPTREEMVAVLGSLTELRIRGDYIFGQSECSLDNVLFGVGVTLDEPFMPFTTYLPLVTQEGQYIR